MTHSVALRELAGGLRAVSAVSDVAIDGADLTGLFSMLCRLFLPFLMWLLSALESRGFKSSKEQSSSPETLITAPQLSNSPQYYRRQYPLPSWNG